MDDLYCDGQEPDIARTQLSTVFHLKNSYLKMNEGCVLSEGKNRTCISSHFLFLKKHHIVCKYNPVNSYMDSKVY